MTDVSEKRDAANKALMALFVEVPESVAKDVRARVTAAFEEADHDAAQLKAALNMADEDIIWMSGSDDFAAGGKAHQGWLRVLRRLNARLRNWRQ